MLSDLKNNQQTNIISNIHLLLLSNIQVTALYTPRHNISDITLVVSGLNYFHNPGIKIA